MGDYIAEIQKIISNCLNKEEVIGVDESLLRHGVDSMNMLFILNEIEIHLDVKIPDSELVISNFETISRIDELLYRLIGKREEHDNYRRI